MNILVLDPCRGRPTAEMLLVDADTCAVRRRVSVGYVPEAVFDSHAREVIMVDTDLVQTNGVATRYWLKTLDADTLEPALQCEIPERPMYAGFPGRSHRVAADPGGRFLYALHSTQCRFSQGDLGFRITVNRFDRRRHELQEGKFHIDSCYLDFGCVDSTSGLLYFHLSCDYPNTVALAKFSSDAPVCVPMDDLPGRTHTRRETCASWLDRESQSLFCVTGEGAIHRVECRDGTCVRLVEPQLQEPAHVPLFQLCGSSGCLWLGVSANDDERSVGLASEVWQIDKSDGRVVRRVPLPEPLMNFAVDPSGDRLAGVNPFSGVMVVMELEHGRTVKAVELPAVSPAEVVFLA